MTDPVLQRLNMIESQVRPSDVTDRRLIHAMGELPREQFVPMAVRDLAYMDGAVPLKTGRYGAVERALLPPMVCAKLIQLLHVTPGDQVLVVGAATGYEVAVLARLARAVIGLESDSELADQAADVLESQGLTNVSLVTGPLAAGHPPGSPYDAILLAGRVPEVPTALMEQLKIGGRLAAMAGIGATCRSVEITRSAAGASPIWGFEAEAATLPGFEPVAKFVFA